MRMHILTRGPHKGYLRLSADRQDKEFIRENSGAQNATSVMSDLIEGYSCNGSFSLLSDHDIAGMNDAGYTSILSSEAYIISEGVSAIQNDNGEFGWLKDYDNQGETGCDIFIKDEARDLEALGIKLYHYDGTYELETEALLRTGHVDFKPLI